MYTMSLRKNIKPCIEALEAARESIPNFRAITLGAQWSDRTLHLPDWIELHYQTAQSAIPEIYASCDAWLFTSETEGFGLLILEAMACRTPVAATSTGAAPQLVSDKTGALIEGNANRFVKQVQRFAAMDDSE